MAPGLDPEALRCPKCGRQGAHKSLYRGGRWWLQCPFDDCGEAT